MVSTNIPHQLLMFDSSTQLETLEWLGRLLRLALNVERGRIDQATLEWR